MNIKPSVHSLHYDLTPNYNKLKIHLNLILKLVHPFTSADCIGLTGQVEGKRDWKACGYSCGEHWTRRSSQIADFMERLCVSCVVSIFQSAIYNLYEEDIANNEAIRF